MTHLQWTMQTPVGPLYLVASETGIQRILLTPQSVPMASNLKGKGVQLNILAQTVEQLEAYFNRKLTQFDLPFDRNGTAFQTRVWQELGQIPYGSTCSYQEIAQRIQHPKAVRAVGSANGKNPLCIVVPCHRVIASDGSLGGYSGGLEVKVKLLDLEKQP